MSAISKAIKDKINSWLFPEPRKINITDNYKFYLESDEVIFGHLKFLNCQLLNCFSQ